MRKYFLLSAVALMAASNVMAATTASTDVEISASVELMSNINCYEPDPLALSVRAGNGDLSIDLANPDTSSTDYMLIAGGQPLVECTFSHKLEGQGSIDLPETVTLTGTSSDKALTLTNLSEMFIAEAMSGVYAYAINATVNIPANIDQDTYTGTFTISATYE